MARRLISWPLLVVLALFDPYSCPENEADFPSLALPIP